jgi:putative transposase
MPRRVYSEINLHITWHTKDNMPLITAAIEVKLHDLIKQKVFETAEVYFHAIGGTKDHIHLAVSVPPTIEIADWIGKLKGSSSYQMNKLVKQKSLEWQHGYGIVSFGTRDLPWVVNYISNQKEHHKKGSIFARLEKIEDTEK